MSVVSPYLWEPLNLSCSLRYFSCFLFSYFHVTFEDQLTCRLSFDLEIVWCSFIISLRLCINYLDIMQIFCFCLKFHLLVSVFMHESCPENCHIDIINGNFLFFLIIFIDLNYTARNIWHISLSIFIHLLSH